jgi:hypothetical protein
MKKWGDAEPRWRWHDEMARDPSINVYDFRVAGSLCAGMDRKGETRKSKSRIVEDTGLDIKTVKRSLQRLLELGWIERETISGGRGRTPVTRLRFPSDARPLPFDPPSGPPAELFSQLRETLKGAAGRSRFEPQKGAV